MAKDLKEQIEIMTHYLNGGEVEVRLENNNRDNWGPASNPSWNWKTYEYRIKPEKQKVTIEKWLIKDVNSSEHFILESSSIDTYKHYEKVKLIESYEVEL